MLANIDFSVIIPTLNEEEHIVKCLRSLLDNDSCFNIEILIVDGCSVDNTINLVKELQNELPDNIDLKIYDNKNRYVPYALNIGLKNATGKYVVILGAHTYVHVNYFKKNIETMHMTNAACVGGTIVFRYNSQMAKDIGIAQMSPFGIGNAKFRYAKKAQYVDTVPYGCYKRELFDDLGKFDEQLIRGQDYEFNHRILCSGEKIFYNPEIISYYYPRTNLKELYVQYYNNGYWKPFAQVKRKHIASIRHIIPGLFVFFLVTGISLSFINRHALFITAMVLLIYLLLSILFSVKAFINGARIWIMPLTFFIIHFSYGSGYIMGSLKAIKNKLKNK